MAYTIGIEELIKRPIIRNDKPEEFLNKMTDDEIRQWEIEVEQTLLKEGVVQKFPDWNAALNIRDYGARFNPVNVKVVQ